jgi:hypothetical protein
VAETIFYNFTGGSNSSIPNGGVVARRTACRTEQAPSGARALDLLRGTAWSFVDTSGNPGRNLVPDCALHFNLMASMEQLLSLLYVAHPFL